ncbi:TetR/AcrR family transcriptional regulator [Rhodococcus sp. D2-41]|uniref:TetR/AcrR family transcriptional regulator n=1 Tax=Speluncibacter jeojiensis TaxID=2710754 RepID=A0A9X4M1B0_9ACTN|nr:TetR/AcrR family transcriptional regulator [Rhodococcus sp. D2-41]MDG3009142.1 TetR/AcrR family transcriptional regulator [Rhodococcus sp. D2-41]MDG3016185.1 TetR/AcrR family transcriptional regulator [Corynebacteriales bacterium D3-21]
MAKHPSAVDLDEAVRAVRVNSRRRQVLDAAVKVMQHTGFHQMSMQALADEAKVSVGLIYKYFGGKEDILLATITDILDAFRDQLEPAMDEAGTDPVERFAAGFRRYAEVVDENIDAVVLTYRESRTLDPEGRERIKELEVSTAAPLRAALEDGIVDGVMQPVDVDLMVFDVMMLAHGWALKQWYVGHRYSLDAYIKAQLGFVLRTLVAPELQDEYAHLSV